MDQRNETGDQAGQSSRGPADARVVHSSTYCEPHLIVFMENEEKLESQQETSEPAVDQANRVGRQEAGQSSRGAADASSAHPPTFSESPLVVEIESNEEQVAPVGARSGVRRRRGEPLRNPRQGGLGRGETGPHRNRGGVVGRGPGDRFGLGHYA